MIQGRDRWYRVGAYLVDSVRNGLSASVTRYGQVPGEVAWDNCTCEGVLAVTVTRVYFAEQFPDEQEQPVGVRCQAPYEVAEFTVVVLRCVPSPQGQEQAPSAADLDSSAGLFLQDAAESLDALARTLCELKDADTISDFMLAPAEAAGPEGDCVGLNIRVLVSLERP